MTSNLFRMLFPILALCAGTIPAQAAQKSATAAQVAGTRQEALAALKSEKLIERRQAYVILAEHGEAEDLPLLYTALHDDDPPTRAVAEHAIWQVWGRSGDQHADQLYEVGVEQMQRGLLRSAVRTFSQIIDLRPEFTEAWNKRATVYFLLEEDDSSIADCDEVLKRNPQHFGALSGYGQLMLRNGDPELALQYFERGLTVNPNMEGVRSMAALLRRLIEERKGRSI
jgi:tetratricopeptide (TPR) repeat protein